MKNIYFYSLKMTLCFVLVYLVSACTMTERRDEKSMGKISVVNLKDSVYAWSTFTSALPDSAISSIENFLHLSETEGNYTDLAAAWKARYYYYRTRDNFTETYTSVLQQIRVAELSKDSTLIADAFYTIGKLLFMNGSYYESLDYFLQMSKMNLTTNKRATLFYALAQVYALTGNSNDLVSRYYDLAEEETKKSDFTNTPIKGYILFGKASDYVPQLDADLFNFYPLTSSRADSIRKATAFSEEALNSTQDYVNYAFLALCYAQLGKIQQSRQYEQKALDMTVNNPERLGAINFARAVIRYREKRFDEAVKFAESGMESSLTNHDLSNAQKNMNVLYHTYQTTGDMGKALYFHKQLTNLNDSIMRKDKQEQAILNQIKYDTKLKDEQILEGKRKYAESVSRTWIFGSGGFLFAILSVILFRLYNQKQKAYQDLVRKNQQWAGVVIAENQDEKEPEGKKITHVIPDIMDTTIMEEIQKLVENGLYKDKNLTMESLAEKICTHQNYISNAINHCTGKNFKTYINEYRIKEAIRIFSGDNYGSLSIDDVAYKSGFNERTNFYRTFKKITGLSPTEFRNNRTTPTA